MWQKLQNVYFDYILYLYSSLNTIDLNIIKIKDKSIAMHRYWMNMIDFYDFQSGSRKNHSTETCLSLLNDNILKDF